MSHDMTKSTKWVCAQRRLRSAWASAQSDQSLRCPPRLIWVFAVRMKQPWVLSYPLSAQRRLWSDWPDAQADPSLRWAHTHFVGFVMSWLICHRHIHHWTTLWRLRKLSIIGTIPVIYLWISQQQIVCKWNFKQNGNKKMIKNDNIIELTN